MKQHQQSLTEPPVNVFRINQSNSPYFVTLRKDPDFSYSLEIFGILLVLLDVCFVLTDLFVFPSPVRIPLEYRFISLSIALFFFIDILLRVFLEGVQPYFSDIVNSIDAVIIVVTLLIDFTYISYDFEIFKGYPRMVFLLRSLRLIILMRIFHVAYQKRRLEKLTRRMVSGNKRRYKKDGFDLDLTYVTDRVIAMSFPSSGQQSFYRNPIQEVVRFLDTKHRNHYQVYNLCSEKAYNPKHFHYKTHRIKIDDHNVPSLSEMLEFSKEVQKWMAEDDKNIVVIHCMGGKGRTGTMVCVCLIACEVFTTAEGSLYYFGERRTDKTTSRKFQGVETPSQNRYVGYFADVKNIYNLTLPPRKQLVIKKIVLYSIHGVGKGNGNDLKVQIIMQHKIVFFCSASKNCRIFHDIEMDRVIIYPCNCPVLYDDVKVKFLSSKKCISLTILIEAAGERNSNHAKHPSLHSSIMSQTVSAAYLVATIVWLFLKHYDNCPFFLWFHTAFIQNNRNSILTLEGLHLEHLFWGADNVRLSVSPYLPVQKGKEYPKNHACRLYLSRNKLDNPHKPKTWKIYRPDFAVEIYFDDID